MMKNTTHTLFAACAALLVCASGAYATDFSFSETFAGATVDAFDTYISGSRWSKEAADDSNVVSTNTYTASGKALALNTNENELSLDFSGDSLPDYVSSEITLQFVGALEDPTPPTGSQFALYLNISGAAPVLKAYVAGSAGGEADWVALSGFTFSAATYESLWFRVRMECNYSAGTIRIFVNNNEMTGASTLYLVGSSPSALSSVGFIGSGLVDSIHLNAQDTAADVSDPVLLASAGSSASFATWLGNITASGAAAGTTVPGSNMTYLQAFVAGYTASELNGGTVPSLRALINGSNEVSASVSNEGRTYVIEGKATPADDWAPRAAGHRFFRVKAYLND